MVNVLSHKGMQTLIIRQRFWSFIFKEMKSIPFLYILVMTVSYCPGLSQINNVSRSDAPTIISTTAKNEARSLTDCSTGLVPFSLTMNTDAYASETTWELFYNSDGTQVFSETELEDNRSYSWQRCIPDDCYTFKIYDSQNDGICCGYGTGNYTIVFDGQTVSTGGEFGSEESVAMGICSNTTIPAHSQEEVTESLSNTSPQEVSAGDETGEATPTIVQEDLLQEAQESSDEACVAVDLYLMTDHYPWETRFTLVDASPSRSSSSSSGTMSTRRRPIWSYSNFRAAAEYQYTACVDPAGCYGFVMTDLFSDGLCCQFGYGSFSLSYDGEVVASYSSFGAQVSVQLGDGCVGIP